ncbi:WPP domain-interacting tail-anchored protein 2-like [Chenopodium quinoa]|uniref:WIT1/2 N-terminal helical bundle domain-containing protein n=1 Tax=Chenopodium quinoa TaxID=63459 RepID=A0A803KVI0_CHEQI|nr:WPP domain-interacting tail-anchored protein 2-like [Chenopodium quinoa]XP_021755982.1 WPP domain-interacting tail-anchored protein 2-like [Chenopodium quinoa]XP_021755988.1 WPP domain-interacting tail-anchored protein 2-like [Chenopodium quinoa]
MGMDPCISNGVDDADSILTSCNSLSNGVSISENGLMEPTMLMELLTLLDLDLAYFSEKLVNLDLYMTIVSLGEIGLGELSMQNSKISEVEIEKALIFDLSFEYLDSEVTELGSFLEVLQAKINDAHQKICLFKLRRDIFTIFQGKLQGSENSWKHLQEQLLELKRQLAKFHKTLSSFREKSTYSIENEDLERSHYDLQNAGQQRLVLSMLEKSFAAELNLEKRLLELKKREEELESELSLTNEVASGMEAFLGVALERLLEVEHSSQVFMGIAKEMMSRLQIYEFNMHCSVQREEELKSKLENSLEQLKKKDKLEQKLEELEKKLQASESKLQEVNACYEASQEQLSEMEDATEALREHAIMAETRAHDAEEKLATLTEENVELREEVVFLKTGDSNEEKITVLEKNVRELEVKLQTSKTFADASQEQQNMLYTAIWDMETLIEELKSKFSKAESKAENAEKQCLELAETNIELNKEKGNLKSENEKLVESLKVANKMKVAWAKEISDGAKLITDMVMQLETERTRVQKQLSSLARENTILLEELRKMRRNLLKANQSNKGDVDKKEIESNIYNTANGIITALSTTEEVVETPTSTTASNQLDEPSEENNIGEATGSFKFDAVAANCINHDEAETAGSSKCVDDAADSIAVNHKDRDNAETAGSSKSNDDATDSVASNHEDATDDCILQDSGSKMKNKYITKKSFFFTAVFVSVLSYIVMYINWQDMYSIITRLQHLNFQ